MIRRLSGYGAVVIAVCLVCSGVAAGAPRIVTARPGNAFIQGEAIRLTLSHDGPWQQVRYDVYDYFGTHRRAGIVWAGDNRAVLVEPRDGQTLGLGFFTLKLTTAEGVWERYFCILPRPAEMTGDYRLFGLALGMSEEVCATAAQIGVRLIRSEANWPEVGRRPGEWDVSLMARDYELSKKHGMQIAYTCGYTPLYMGEKPIHGVDGWVEAARFTWHPRDPNVWAEYIAQVAGFAKDKSINWPPDAIVPMGTSATVETVPWVLSWEVWNEVDIMYYVGDWARYEDLLRLAWCVYKRETPDKPVIYGGSTGNFPAMGMVASNATKYYFDYMAAHLGGPVDAAMRGWHRGISQIPYCVGLPRETVHTEGYMREGTGPLHDTLYQETPGRMWRTYINLKAWRQEMYLRSGCIGGYIGDADSYAPGTAMLVRDAHGRLEPTPLYPAFAAIRLWLSDAIYVGPANLGSRAEGHVFLKDGQVMLAAWSDQGTTVAVHVEPGAFRVDHMGRRIMRPWQASWPVQLDENATVIVGVRTNRYLPQALRARYALVASTPYGHTDPQCGLWYVKSLQADLADCAGPHAPQRLQAAVDRAAAAMSSPQANCAAALIEAQRTCGQIMQTIAHNAQRNGELTNQAANTLFRLALTMEWLGEVADGRAERWGSHCAKEAELTSGEAFVAAAREETGSIYTVARLPFTEQLLDRAGRQVWRAQQRGRRGGLVAAEEIVKCAQEIAVVETPQILDVVILGEFTTSLPIRKSRLLEPGREHVFETWVYNFLDEPVEGVLTYEFPAGWRPRIASRRFHAPPGSISGKAQTVVTLPADPVPWVRTASFTLDGNIPLSLPPSLNDQQQVRMTGRLSDGRPLAPVLYPFNVGRIESSSSLAFASRSPRPVWPKSAQYVLQVLGFSPDQAAAFPPYD